MARAYVMLNNEEIEGTVSFNRSYIHNSHSERNLNFDIVTDNFNFATKQSGNFEFKAMVETEVRNLEVL